MKTLYTAIFTTFIIALTACTPSTAMPSQTNVVPATRTATITVSPTSTYTIESVLTNPPSKTPSPIPTQTPVPPTTTPLPLPANLVIAFTRDDTLWVWKNGIETQIAEAPIESLDLLVNTNKVALSSDGQKIAFTKGDKEIWVINVDGTDERLLVDREFYSSLGIDRPYKIKWLPNSHVLLFNTYSYPQTGIYHPSYDFHIVDADTGNLTTIALPENGGDIYPSPDGKIIALISSTSISLIDIDGNHQKTILTYPFAPVSGEDDFIFSSKPVWAEDSQSFIIAIPNVDIREFPPTADTKIWRIDVQSSSAELILQKDLNPFRPGPIISPNLKYILYNPATIEDEEINRLYLFQVEHSEEKLLYEEKNFPYVVSWFPNSDQFIMLLDQKVFLGDKEGNIIPKPQINPNNLINIRWLDSEHYFWVNEENELCLEMFEGSDRILITTLGHIFYDVYDFAP